MSKGQKAINEQKGLRENMEKTIVSSSPHIRAKNTTSGIMTDVVIALMPAILAATYYFGIRAVYLTIISVAFSVLFEYLWQKALKKPVTVHDGTAVVTGVLLALNVPVTAPWWMVAVGDLVAIIIIKQFFGGTGHNFMNPAMGARAFLLASWPVAMTHWVKPFTTGFVIDADVISSATPLAHIKSGNIAELPPLLDMFTGNILGCLGEVCVPALLLGFIYLLIKKVITPTIPVAFVGTVFVLSVIFKTEGLDALRSGLYAICSGGLLLGAIFMATDYATSPITTRGHIIMGIGCGAITFLIRRFGGYPEGVTYAILLMNIATPLIDKFARPKKFGVISKRGGAANA